MQPLTQTELNEKIQSFMVSRIEKYPELAEITTQSGTARREVKKVSFFHSIFPSQLKAQF